MEIPTVLMLLVAGAAGGVLSALAGGASLVLFPAMLAAGIPPVVAVATNNTALVPSNFLAAFADRTHLPKFDRAFLILLALTTAATTVGAVMLLVTPDRVLEFLVPLLLGFGTVLFAYAKPVGAWLGRLSFGKSKTTLHPNAIGLGMMVPVSVYSGYFGAGAGVLMIAALSVANGGNYRAANVAKNLPGSLSSVAAAIIFAACGKIAWIPALVVATGALGGGLTGGYLARVLPPATARLFIVAFGVLLTAIFTWKYWF
jgi:uncharacterized membrane protein YfcA